MQIKTTMSYHLIPVQKKKKQKKLLITNVCKDVEKREPLYITGRNVNWCKHQKHYRGFSKKEKQKKKRKLLVYDPTILLLVICLKETKTLM